MAECNSLVNPIIYTLRDEELRRTFRWILCSLCRRNGQREVSAIEFAPAPNTPQVHVQDAWVPLTIFDHWRISCSVPVCRKLPTLSRSQKSTRLNPIMKAAGVSGGCESCRSDAGTSWDTLQKNIVWKYVFLLHLSQTTSCEQLNKKKCICIHWKADKAFINVYFPGWLFSVSMKVKDGHCNQQMVQSLLLLHLTITRAFVTNYKMRHS